MYRIITYRDPYHLEKTSFWEEIKSLPHFCASDVMARSLWSLYYRYAKDKFENYFWALEELVNAAYPHWKGSIEKQIQQYIAVSRQLRIWEKQDQNRRPELFSSLLLNRGPLLEGLRAFTELGIVPDSLHKDLANIEQKVFISLYEKIHQGDGDLPRAFDLEEENDIYDHVLWIRLMDQSIKREIDKQKSNSNDSDDRDKRISILNQLRVFYQEHTIRKIVVHGIHQFKPLQLRLITELEKHGYEIIFLYNYLPEYRHLYSTWNRLYSWFDVPIIHDNTPESPLSERDGFTESYELARTIAGILNSEAPVSSAARRSWLESTSQVTVTCFENVSEMANYVSEVLKDSQIPGEKFQVDPWIMNEKIYATSKDVDELLKVYFPENSGERHFLNYPIGQFFTSIYEMWDENSNQLKFDLMALKICAFSGVLFQDQAIHLHKLIDVVSPLLSDITFYRDVSKRLVDYQSLFEEVQFMSDRGVKSFAELKLVGFYNDSLINKSDIKLLIDFINSLESTAEMVFQGETEISFKAHFTRLLNFIRGKEETLVLEEERRLVDNLLERFDRIHISRDLKGTVEDLRRGLYYYLKQNEDKENNAAWLVRNFEQIEGDILKSRGQIRGDREITYHFAGLSDGLICRKTDEILPWPLTDYFVHTAYSPNALVFQLYYSALCSSQQKLDTKFQKFDN